MDPLRDTTEMEIVVDKPPMFATPGSPSSNSDPSTTSDFSPPTLLGDMSVDIPIMRDPDIQTRQSTDVADTLPRAQPVDGSPPIIDVADRLPRAAPVESDPGPVGTPLDNQAPRHRNSTATGNGVAVRVGVATVVALSLSTQHLINVAARLPFGPYRSIMVAITETIHTAAGLARLDEPDLAIRAELGRSTDGSAVSTTNPVPSADLEPLAKLEAAGPTVTTGGPKTPAEGSDDPDRRSTNNPMFGGPGTPTTSGKPTTTLPLIPPPAGDNPVATTHPSSSASSTRSRLLRTVTANNPLRLWAGGDSLGQYVGNQLLAEGADADHVEVVTDFHISTGLTRPDFFDWPLRMAELVADEDRPEALVFMVGGNDNQNMAIDGEVIKTGTSAWKREYQTRAGSIMDAVEDQDSHLIWVGLPPMRDVARQQITTDINAAISAAARTRPWVTFVDINEMFGEPAGTYIATITYPDGTRQTVRQNDGVHINFDGSLLITAQTWQMLSELWRFPQTTTRPR